MPIYRFDVASKGISTDTGLSTPSAVFVDLATDTLYLCEGSSIRPMHAAPPMAGLWRSRLFKVASGAMTGFAWAQVKGRLSSGVVLRLYADGQLIYTTPPMLTGEPERLPAVEARSWEVEVASSDRITSVVIADSLERLLR